ncbi:ATP-grasp domain-containing protein [Dyella sp. KRB-257]|uniref:ATP-grasp domain-containing protein n=1 Tax=Dyella sp. KRB-257 TaxID=3400915 RepID=UPI003C0A6170
MSDATAEALARHPPRLGLAALLRSAFRHEDLSVHLPSLIERAERDDAYALLDLALIQQMRFRKENGLALLRQALQLQQLYRIGDAPADALHVLVIKTPGDLMANTPVECLLEDAGFRVDALYVGAALPWPSQLPAHDLVFVAISEADAHVEVLQQLDRYLADWSCPVLNRPARIPALSRGEAFTRLADVDAIRMATTIRVSRQALEQVAADPARAATCLPGVGFPVIVRPLGSHAGTQLERIATPADLGAYLAGTDASRFFVADFIDYAAPDGLFRKYRIVLIDGRPFVCHMGISQHWMVHYPYEEMTAHADRRAEEAACMAGFDDDFARRHAAAFAAIAQRFGLDYIGMDCAQTADGRLLVFEFANALVVHAIDDPALFPYKAAQMRKVLGAFAGMLQRRATPDDPASPAVTHAV